METLISRYRNVTILVAILFVQVLGLAVQVKRRSGADESTRAHSFVDGQRRHSSGKSPGVVPERCGQSLDQLRLSARGAPGKSRSEIPDRATPAGAGAPLRRRTTGPPLAGPAGLQGTVHREDCGRTGDRFERQRTVALDLHRQGKFSRSRKGHGGDYRRWSGGQGIARVRTPQRKCS